MIRIEKQARLYAIRSSYFSPALRAAAKQTPGMRWEPVERSWVGYPDAVAACADALSAANIHFQGVVPTPSVDGTTPLAVAYQELRDYQKEAVRFVLREAPTGALLALGLGLGKSACALRAAKALRLPTVVVCPAFVQGVWGDDPDSESKKWWPEAWPPRVLEGVKGGRYVVRFTEGPDVPYRWLASRPEEGAEKAGRVVWGTTPEEAFEFGSLAEAQDTVALAFSRATEEKLHFDPIPIEPTPLTIVNDAILYAWAPHMPWCRFLIIDECHRGGHDTSRRSKAMRLLAQCASNRVGLSGTPQTNRTRDLWNVVDILSPGRFGEFFPYAKRYCDARRVEVAKNKVVWKFDGSSNIEELNKRLKHFLYWRTKEDVGLQLPEKTRQLIHVTVKRKALSPTRNLVVDGKINDKAMRRALDLAADGKMVDVLELTRSHVADGARVVVFTYRRAMAEYLCNGLLAMNIQATYIHGELAHKERQARMKRDWQVLCATIDVTAGGINLAMADVGIFAELTYEPHEILQCEGRWAGLRGEGKANGALFQYVLARGTVDEIIAKMIVDKLNIFEKTFGRTGENWQESIHKSEDRRKVLNALAARLKAQDVEEAAE